MGVLAIRNYNVNFVGNAAIGVPQITQMCDKPLYGIQLFIKTKAAFKGCHFVYSTVIVPPVKWEKAYFS